MMEKYDVKNVKIPSFLYQNIEEDVTKLHIELELSIPVKPKIVAEKLGYDVHYLSEKTNKLEQRFLRRDEEGKIRDGYSFFNPKTHKFEIWVNDIDSSYYEHDDFTIAHEIGHIRSGHRSESDLANKIANYYAAYLLVPSPLMYLFKCVKTEHIQKKFQVSIQCASLCEKRFYDWLEYGGPEKSYERRIKEYYKKIVQERNNSFEKGDNCL